MKGNELEIKKREKEKDQGCEETAAAEAKKLDSIQEIDDVGYETSRHRGGWDYMLD